MCEIHYEAPTRPRWLPIRSQVWREIADRICRAALVALANLLVFVSGRRRH